MFVRSNDTNNNYRVSEDVKKWIYLICSKILLNDWLGKVYHPVSTLVAILIVKLPTNQYDVVLVMRCHGKLSLVFVECGWWYFKKNWKNTHTNWESDTLELANICIGVGLIGRRKTLWLASNRGYYMLKPYIKHTHPCNQLHYSES